MLRVIGAVAVLVCLYGTAQAQPRVDPRNSYERILAVVPLVGTGTVEDPIRPMFAPAPNALSTAAPSVVGQSAVGQAAIGPTGTTPNGIIAYTYVLSDDGKFALTEFVLRDQRSFGPVLSAASAASIKTFQKGVNTRADIEAEFRKYKADFDASKFGVMVR